MLVATLREGAPAPAPAGVMVASNRFLPNFPRAPIRGGTPLPQGRPYDLGEGGDRVAAAAPQPRTTYAKAAPANDLFAERPAPVRRSRTVVARAAEPAEDEPRVDPRRLAAEALARQPSRPHFVETSPDTPQTAYLPRGRAVVERNPSPASPSVPAPSAVTAYAPMYFDGGAVSTGRGLY
jgi:hypothetical protein